MTVIDPNSDPELSSLWTAVAQLSEQLNCNRQLSVSLFGQAGKIKTQALHSQTGFILRRFNLDKTKEAFENELERMNTAMASENQALQHDNKQLNALIKEYEQTLDNVMGVFRNRARDVQEHELSLVREYEKKLLEREEEYSAEELRVSTSVSQSLARLSHLFRQTMRSLQGEASEDLPKTEEGSDAEDQPRSVGESAEGALERECELARLEQENEMLRRMLNSARGLPDIQPRRSAPELSRIATGIPVHNSKYLGGAPGTVGPFGTYKKLRSSG